MTISYKQFLQLAKRSIRDILFLILLILLYNPFTYNKTLYFECSHILYNNNLFIFIIVTIINIYIYMYADPIC